MNKLRGPWSWDKARRFGASRERRDELVLRAASRMAGAVRCYHCGESFAGDRELLWHRVPRRIEADARTELLRVGACFPVMALPMIGLVVADQAEIPLRWRLLGDAELAELGEAMWDTNPWTRSRFYLGPGKGLDRP